MLTSLFLLMILLTKVPFATSLDAIKFTNQPELGDRLSVEAIQLSGPIYQVSKIVVLKTINLFTSK